MDAVRLAEKDGTDTTTWDDHVEFYILKLADKAYFNDPVVHYGYVRGIEPFTYVFEIFERYEHYKEFVP
jgi:membrane-bound lytic murein transglycosylase F